MRLNGDAEFTRYLTPDGLPQAPEFSEAQLARFRAHWDEHGYGLWAVEERETGRFAGRVGLSNHRLWPHDVELGWAIDSELWGRGYATEVGSAALVHAFETLAFQRVVSIIHPENAASIRVAEKLGERPHATVWWPEGELELLVYAAERAG